MTVGWLVTIVLSWSGARSGAYGVFGLAAGLSALLAGYCLTLPDTPPLDVGPRRVPGSREALELIRRPSMAVFLGTAFGVGLTTPFIYQVMPPYLESRGLPRAWISTAMTLGQYPEIAALAALPWLFRRLHYKGTLALGIGAYAVRYASLALDPPLWVAVAGIPLHGFGVACFTIGGQIFIDGQAPANRRAGAQALLMVLTTGIGSLLGSLLAGEVLDRFPGDYPLAFLIPCVINVGMLATFWAGFRPHLHHASLPETVASDEGRRPAVLPPGNLAPEPAEG
jgi:MFS family permease